MIIQGDSFNRARILYILYINFIVKNGNAPQSFRYVDNPTITNY
jgi:hypothetical protein